VANLNFYAIKVDEPLGEVFSFLQAFHETELAARPVCIERALWNKSLKAS
jgi:hypothetical protein